MIRLFICFFMVLLAPNLQAQKPSVFKVPLEIDLTISPPGRLFGIDTIVDIRTDTSQRIGSWQRSSGKITELRFKENFQPALSNFVYSVITNFDWKLPAYTLLVQEFDLTSAPDNNRFELAVTFSGRRNGQQNPPDTTGSLFIPVYTADIIVEGNADSFTAIIKKGLAKAFLKFNDYLASPSTVASHHSDFAIEAAKAAQDLNLTQATYDSARTDEDNLIRCSQLRSGIYQSFNDLKQNRPSLTGTLAVQEKNGFATIRKQSGSRDKHRFFGFSDGKDLFISTGLYQSTGFIRRYVKIQSVGRYLLWIDNYLTTAELMANATGAAFGLIGALAASSVNSYRDCIALDMQTGGVFMVTKDKLAQMLAGHDDLLTELGTMPDKKDEQQQLRLLDQLNRRSRLTAAH